MLAMWGRGRVYSLFAAQPKASDLILPQALPNWQQLLDQQRDMRSYVQQSFRTKELGRDLLHSVFEF